MPGEEDYDNYEEYENDPLDDFTDHWDQLIDEIETLELTPYDVSKWYATFKADMSNFSMYHSADSNYTDNEQSTRMKEIKDFLEIAITKGKTKYRNNERIRLKETYGALSEIVYWFRLIFRTI
jgi:hypothetical protein